MKNRHRMLALFLAAVLFLSAMLYTLPVLASPGVPLNGVTLEPATVPADGSPLDSSFADYRWVFNTKERAITYRGGWSGGYLTEAGYAHFTHVNSSSNTWLTKDTGDQWQSPAGTIEHSSLNMRAATGAGHATAMGFTAPLSGTVSFSFDRYTPVPGDVFAIFVGTRMVFPTAGINFAEAENRALWYTVTAETDAAALNRELDQIVANVLEGETISFAFRGSGNGYHVSVPRVTYRMMSKPAVSTSRINFKGENFPAYTGSNGNFKLARNLRGGWSLGSFSRDLSRPFEAFTQLDATYCILNMNGSDQWTYGGLYLQTGILITTIHNVTAFSYEAPAAGRANICVNNITANKSDSGQDIVFCILHNGKMIWPSVGGSLTNYDDWYNLCADGANVTSAAASSSNLQDVRLATGDTVQFCFVAKQGHSMTTKDIDLAVAYTTIDSSLPKPDSISTSLADNYPLFASASAGGGLLAYRGRWQYAAAQRGESEFFLLKTTDGENNLLPGSTRGEGYMATSLLGASAAGLCPGEVFDIALLYEARYSGHAQFSLGITELSASDRYTISLLRNEQELFTQTATAVELSAVTIPFDCKTGDRITLRVSRPAGETGESPLYLAPTLSYTTLTNSIAITGFSMALSSDFSVRINTAASISYLEAKAHGVLVWHEGEDEADAVDLQTTPNSNNTCTYVYTGLSAKQMGEVIYLRPYAINDAGDHVVGEVYRFSIAEYAMALYGTDALRNRMLTDMLSYGAAAQIYFNYRTDRLVTDLLTPAQRLCGTQGGHLFSDCFSIGEEPESTLVTSLQAISLLLDSSLSMRIYTLYDEQEEKSLFVEVATTPDFNNAKSYRLRDGIGQIPVPIGEVGRTFYIRLRTAAYGRMRYSAVYTYSVESYIAHTAALPDVALCALNEALLAYGNSARAYAYERETAMKTTG